MTAKEFWVKFLDGGEAELVKCDRITWLTGWVTFTKEGFLVAAYPGNTVAGVFEKRNTV